MEFLMETAPKQGFMTLIVPFALMFAILYLLIIRPQKRKQKQLQEMITNIRKNDNVVTAGGVHGVVVSVKEKEVIIRVDDSKDVKLKIDKSAVTSVSVPKSEREEDKQ
jgi:preprotein translocase subunit YajC